MCAPEHHQGPRKSSVSSASSCSFMSLAAAVRPHPHQHTVAMIDTRSQCDVTIGKAEAATVSDRSHTRVAVLTGGGDRPYALGLAAALLGENIPFDFIGSNEVNGPEL